MPAPFRLRGETEHLSFEEIKIVDVRSSIYRQGMPNITWSDKAALLVKLVLTLIFSLATTPTNAATEQEILNQNIARCPDVRVRDAEPNCPDDSNLVECLRSKAKANSWLKCVTDIVSGPVDAETCIQLEKQFFHRKPDGTYSDRRSTIRHQWAFVDYCWRHFPNDQRRLGFCKLAPQDWRKKYPSCSESLVGIPNKISSNKKRSNRGSGGPHKEEPLTGSFKCPRGSYGVAYPPDVCTKFEKLARAGYDCGGFAFEYCVKRLFERPDKLSDCTTLKAILGDIDGYSKCVSLFPGSTEFNSVCKSAFAKENVFEIANGKCLTGADANWRNAKKQSALHLAVLNFGSSKGFTGFGTGHTEYIASAVDDVNAQDSLGNTALHYANDVGLNWVFRRIARKVNLKLLNNNGETILISILKNGHHPLTSDVEALVKVGLDINAKDKSGKTALDYLPNVQVPPSWPKDYLERLKAQMIALGAG